MRFEKTIFAVALAGTAGFVAVGAAAYGGVRAGDGLEGHLALSLAAAMAMLFPHLWVLFFLFASGRGLRRAIRRSGAGEGSRELSALTAGRRLRWLAFAAVALAVAAATALLASGVVAFTRTDAPRLHNALFYLTAVVQLAALVVEWRALVANAALFTPGPQAHG